MSQKTESVKLVETYRCPECSDEFGAAFLVEDHYEAKHGGSPPRVPAVSRKVNPDRIFESLRTVSNHAKNHAELAKKNYHRENKREAHANSIKKQALYDLKTAVLEILVGQGLHDEVEVKLIKGRSFYCFYFGNRSFYEPIDEWTGPDPSQNGSNDGKSIGHDGSRDDSKESEDANKRGGKPQSDMSLKTALVNIQRIFNESANDYLAKTCIPLESGDCYFLSWDCLE